MITSSAATLNLHQMMRLHRIATLE